MPEEAAWERFFNPEAILSVLDMDRSVSDVLEFGCGYGTFTIPTAGRIRGKIYAIDIEPSLVARVRERALAARAGNVEVFLRDFAADGSGLDDGCVDYVMLFNILHAEDPQGLLAEAYRVLKPGGSAAVIHWNYDPATPRGPPMAIRPKPEHCVEWGMHAGFDLVKRLDLPPYHYGLLFRRPASGERKI
jgi:SAM-dependent methyltransferase